MSGVNRVIIVGRLGKNPDVKTMQDGTYITNFSVATSEEWKDKNTGEKKERTEWHRIVAYRKLGEICGQWLKKGQQVYIEGKLQTRKYEKDGQTLYTTEIIADTMQMIGTGKNSEQPSSHTGNQPQNTHNQSKSNGYVNDDIPF